MNLPPAPRVSRDDERWFSLLSREIEGFVARRVRDPQEAEDVTQDVLLRIVRGLDGVREHERIGAWVTAVARRGVIDHYRRARRDVPSDECDTWEGESSVDDEWLSSLPQTALAAWLPHAIDSLDEPYRATLRATELEGVDYATQAAREGVSVSAIKSRVARGRRKLREAVERCCDVELDARQRVVGLRGRDCDCQA